MSSDYEVWPFICQMILFFLMIVGGCSSSTSGGLKAIRILIISKLIRRGISLRLHPNVIETVKLDGKTPAGRHGKLYRKPLFPVHPDGIRRNISDLVRK